ncbi:transglutaminaseTgpA domain-containing protein [Paenibacillus thermotolerans]|uniref:transglutaminase family protein n=1 Tax=Paenibacillus thermotolerans TaxID=3027807 RepID=UPI0023686F14|nr:MULTISPECIES: transglutaminase domain-containing protein [unclassified Paenibacillus]
MSQGELSIRRLLFTNWHEKGINLFLGIFLYQLIIWFDAYWVNETKPVVVGALTVSYVVECFTKRPAWLRRLAGIAAVIAVTGYVVRPEPAAGELEGVPLGFLLSVLEYVLRLHPFIWFAAGTWALFIMLSGYLTSRWRIFALMVFGIVLLSVVDSFSSFVFWDQVAIMIGCGLTMLVIHHLQQLRLRDPEGYDNLMSYPVPIFVMVVTIITASLALGMLAPNIRPVIMDPYTAWKTYQGEAVPAFGKSGGWFGESTTRNASSGYSRNDTHLGAAFDFDYSPVFSVDTSRRSYWRGETRSYYNGNGWEPTSREMNHRLLPVGSSAEAPKRDYETNMLETVEITQTFRMADGRSYPVLFAAPYAQTVEAGPEVSEEAKMRMYWQGEQNGILWFESSGIDYPSVYTVTSQMPVIDEEKLRQSAPVTDTELLQDYLQLPNIPDRVRLLAQKVTEEADNPYDKAKALKTYLSTSFPYTNTPDVSKGTSADFVDRFLFEIQEGYCDYYSTAMVVMARSIGLPARWVKGYIPGQSDMEFIYRQYLPGEERDYDGPGTYTVRNSDAHSWVEVFFEGFGWIPFEPTAGFSLPIVQTENETEVALPADLGETTEALVAEKGTSGTNHQVWIAALSAVVAIAGIVWMSVRFQWIALLRTRGFRKSPNYNLKFLGEMERLLYRMRRKGLHWTDNETVREMMQRWMKEHAFLQNDLNSLMLTFEKAKYSKNGLSEQEYWNAETLMRKLRESLR